MIPIHKRTYIGKIILALLLAGGLLLVGYLEAWGQEGQRKATGEVAASTSGKGINEYIFSIARRKGFVNMNCDEKHTILEICKRDGRYELFQFIRTYPTSDIVEMIEDGGCGDHLVEWFKDSKPEEFYDEYADNDAYIDACELEMNARREDAIIGRPA